MKSKLVNFCKQSIASSIIELLNCNDFDIDQVYNGFSKPPKWENGHLAIACFIFTKALKKKPNDIALELSEKLSSNDCVLEAKSMGPYLNIFLDFKVLGERFLNSNLFENDLFSDTQKTMIEYSQPNTHKELHVGHMRNLCFGNALTRTFRYSGIDTKAVTYPGDVGTHVAKTLWYLNKFKPEIPNERKGAWLGTIYTKAHNLLEEQRSSENEGQNRKDLTLILKELKSGSGKYYDLWLETKSWSIELMKSVYNWADVKFDKWFFESEVDSESLKLVDHYYKEGLFVLDDGAIGIDLSDDKLGFLLLKKSDGNGLYATKDLELARKKFEELNIERNLYIVDVRQSLHFKQVFKTLEKMGFKDAKNCEHLAYEFVELPDGAMSSRKGNIIALEDLTKQMETHIRENYLNKYIESWDEKEIALTSKIIANGAIKYGMCRYDSQRKIVFDMNEWLKLDGNSGPYLQYTYARIRSILRKMNYNKDENLSLDYSLLSTDIEKQILLKLMSFNEVVQTVVQKLSPHHMCNYLYDLCQDFNRFYAEVSIQNSSKEEQKVRLVFIDTYSSILKMSLSLLGIDVPSRM